MVSERKTMSIYFKKHGEIKKGSKWVFNDTFEKQEGYPFPSAYKLRIDAACTDFV